jgi:hypothetical protein
MSNIIQNFVPDKFSARVKAIFDVYEEIINDYKGNSLDIVNNIYNVNYDLPNEIIDLVLELLGFTIADLSFFSMEKQTKIRKEFFRNIILYYIHRHDIIDIYSKFLMWYEITSSVYFLNTVDYSEFFKVDYFSFENLKTDTGIKTDTSLKTDNDLLRTYNVLIEIYLNKIYDDFTALWFKDIDKSIKSQLEQIRFILTKIIFNYMLQCTFTEQLNEYINGIYMVFTDNFNTFDLYFDEEIYLDENYIFDTDESQLLKDINNTRLVFGMRVDETIIPALHITKTLTQTPMENTLLFRYRIGTTWYEAFDINGSIIGYQLGGTITGTSLILDFTFVPDEILFHYYYYVVDYFVYINKKSQTDSLMLFNLSYDSVRIYEQLDYKINYVKWNYDANLKYDFGLTFDLIPKKTKIDVSKLYLKKIEFYDENEEIKYLTLNIIKDIYFDGILKVDLTINKI